MNHTRIRINSWEIEVLPRCKPKGTLLDEIEYDITLTYREDGTTFCVPSYKELKDMEKLVETAFLDDKLRHTFR